MTGRLFEETFESADETGRMLVANRVGNFLDAHVALKQKESSTVQALFNQASAETGASLRLKQMLEMRSAQMEFQSEVSDSTKGTGFDYIEDFAEAGVLRCRGQEATFGCAGSEAGGFVDRR